MDEELLTADERAEVINLINSTLEEKGINLEVCGYNDDGCFFNLQLWKRLEGKPVIEGE